MAKYRILSLDGGGIRGILTTTLLERLEERVPGWLARTDLIAGTSTGGLIALGLASGNTPAQLTQFYKDKGPDIFKPSIWRTILSLNGFFGAKYGTEPRRKAFTDILGQTRLEDLHPRVLIPAFDLDHKARDGSPETERPKYFHNFPGTDSDGKERAVDVGLYTSAAPSYFPSVGSFIDGGVVVNNPSMSAIAQTQDSRSIIEPRPKIDEIVLISLGTGNTITYVKGKNMNWGLFQWAQPLLHILLDSEGGISDYQCRQLLGENYWRLNPMLPSGRTIDLDDVAEIPLLIKIAKDVELDKLGIIAWLQDKWMS